MEYFSICIPVVGCMATCGNLVTQGTLSNQCTLPSVYLYIMTYGGSLVDRSHSLTACYHGYSGGNTNVETVPTHPMQLCEFSWHLWSSWDHVWSLSSQPTDRQLCLFRVVCGQCTLCRVIHNVQSPSHPHTSDHPPTPTHFLLALWSSQPGLWSELAPSWSWTPHTLTHCWVGRDSQ